VIAAQENIALLIDGWRLFVERLPKGTIESGDGVVSLFANKPLAFFNLSVLDRAMDATALREAFAVATLRASGCPHDSYVAFSESLVPQEWRACAALAGWHPAMDLTAMDAAVLLPPRRDLPSLQFQRVTDKRTATDLALVNAHAYALPVDSFGCMFNLDLWREDSIGIVGYFDGLAVTASAVFPVAETAYAAFVATLPEHHGKGFAEAALRHAIPAGKRVTMHATSAGKPIYLRMGFAAGDRTIVLSRNHA
jgi:GNAT superfamily N-acetyltransferase